jgi:hypothetical protein
VQLKTKLKVVLIVGSAPDALRMSAWDTSGFAHRVVINNAWQVCPSWDFLIYPEDFPVDRHPSAEHIKGKKCITSEDFVPEQNRFGGFVYAGGTMAFTAAYWALGALKPDVMAYVGCDMVYASCPGQATHFYGQGVADPLRQDVTLQSLEAKSVRLMALAHQQGCSLVNLSDQASSRLMVPRMGLQQLSNLSASDHEDLLKAQSLDEQAIEAALSAEAQLKYMVPSGRYWEVANAFDKDKLRAIDDLWLSAAVNGAPVLA